MSQYRISFLARWNVEYDYDTSYNCQAEGCDSICRCGRIQNLTVTSVTPSLSMVWIEEGYMSSHKKPHQLFRPYKPSLIEQYCIDRILRIHRAYDHSLYTAYTTSGYYGEEVGDVSFANANEVVANVTELLKYSSDIDKVKYVLKREYTYLLDKLTDTASVSIEHHRPISLMVNDHYTERIKRDVQQYHRIDGLPVGVVHQGRLIDGYHRMATLHSDTMYPFICLE